MGAKHYRDLIAWQRAMDAVVAIYEITRAFPSREAFGLTSQMQRAAISIASNIAEGQGRGACLAFSNHLRIANGSRQELETQIMIAVRLGYLNATDGDSALERLSEVGRLLAGLIRSLG